MFYLNKKGDVNQVFVYAVSTIVVVFVGVLAVSFVSTLGADVGDRTISNFMQSIERDLSAMQTDFNSEEINSYRIPGSISKLVFITPACSNSEYEVFIQNNEEHFLVAYDSSNQILSSLQLIEFGTQGGCLEFNRSNSEFIELALINERNQIIIQDLT